jgi:hypothetical protein
MAMKCVQPQVSWSNYDSLYTCYINYPQQVIFKHVKGHQDNTTNGETLSIEAQLNILTDSQATKAHTDPSVLPEAQYTSNIYLNGKVLTGKLPTSLRNEINSSQITTYYRNFFGEHHNNVSWDVFYSTILHFKRLPKGVHKMIHNIAPIQQTKCQRQHITDGSCFFCNTSIETIQHVVTCPSWFMNCKSMFTQDIRGSLKQILVMKTAKDVTNFPAFVVQET